MAAIGSEYGKFSFVPEECQLKICEAEIDITREEIEKKIIMIIGNLTVFSE